MRDEVRLQPDPPTAFHLTSFDMGGLQNKTKTYSADQTALKWELVGKLERWGSFATKSSHCIPIDQEDYRG